MSVLENIIDQLASATVEEEKVVDFSKRGLKLDSDKDAEDIVCAIRNCPGMTTLRLEGNTIGINAAKAIAKALESQPNFKYAQWRDMFTQRTEHEIPEALNFLSSGIMLANAHLVTLDLSDNAFGPRGLKGIVNLLKSTPCYSLKELYLNNNGLGISGAIMLADALSQCLSSSTNDGTPLKLKVFVCGRNRLENEGSLALSRFLRDVGSLEHIEMPQNGIYHEGISGLAEAFAANPLLRFLSLEDNSITEEGALELAKHLPSLPNLEVINFGDCLLRSGGAKILAESLKDTNPKLRELLLGFNEINAEEGLRVVEAVKNKKHLNRLVLNGNQFGDSGCHQITSAMIKYGKGDLLSSFSDDEGDEDEEENEGEEDDDNVENGHLDEEESGDEEDYEQQISEKHQSPLNKSVTIVDFISEPTSNNLIGLHGLNLDLMANLPENATFANYFSLLQMVAQALEPGDKTSENAAFHYADIILSTAYENAAIEEMWKFNNDFLVELGLIKGEDKKKAFLPDMTGIFVILEHSVQQNYFRSSTKELLQFFLSKPMKFEIGDAKVKHKLLQTLNNL